MDETRSSNETAQFKKNIKLSSLPESLMKYTVVMESSLNNADITSDEL